MDSQFISRITCYIFFFLLFHFFLLSLCCMQCCVVTDCFNLFSTIHQHRASLLTPGNRAAARSTTHGCAVLRGFETSSKKKISCSLADVRGFLLVHLQRSVHRAVAVLLMSSQLSRCRREECEINACYGAVTDSPGSQLAKLSNTQSLM